MSIGMAERSEEPREVSEVGCGHCPDELGKSRVNVSKGFMIGFQTRQNLRSSEVVVASFSGEDFDSIVIVVPPDFSKHLRAFKKLICHFRRKGRSTFSCEFPGSLDHRNAFLSSQTLGVGMLLYAHPCNDAFWGYRRDTGNDRS
jgi:hypothetical protein